ncbi:MAG: MerR family transcriptional regulator [Oscillospiraceae bacterium]|nr:MerR family transcriptional regulator [Oscillospiraceae bacterium]
MKDFLSIQAFSKLSGIETTTLRYWDDIGLFPPAKRDPLNNYRYYAPDQIIAANFITVLSELNIPLKTIREMDRKRTPEIISELLEQQEKSLDMMMHRLRQCYSIIHTRRELINYGMKLQKGFRVVDGKRMVSETTSKEGLWIDADKISVLHREDKALIFGPRNEFNEGEGFHEPFTNFCNRAEELRINLNFPIGAYHDDMESFLKAPGEPNHFFSIDPSGNRKREAGNYLVGFARGYYGQFGDLPERMSAYAKENALTISGPVYTIYLHDEICIKDPSQYLTQVCVAVS